MYNAYQYNTPLYNITAQVSLLFHYLFDGNYRTQALATNRIVIVGQGAAGAPPQGEDSDISEYLVGERLDIKPNPYAATSALATQLAAAGMDKARLDGKDGFITLPPHCGVMLYDVITIQDSLCSQEATTFRVMGIRLVYDPPQHLFYQKLTLGAV